MQQVLLQLLGNGSSVSMPFKAPVAKECTLNSDLKFGPIHDCRFDFTLLFEQSILSSLPAGILLLVSLPITFQSLKQAPKVFASRIGAVKLILSLIYTILQLGLLVIWASGETFQTPASIPSAVISLAAALQVTVLSYYEHRRLVRPSFFLETFFLFSVLLDIPQARTLFILDDQVPGILGLFITSIAIRFILLVLEAAGKRAYLFSQYQHLSPEATAGLINRSFLWWLSGLLLKGTREILTPEDLYELDPILSAEYWHDRIKSTWEKTSRKSTRLSVVTAFWLALWRPLTTVIFPKFCSILFKFLQPLLIGRLLTLISHTDDESVDESYGLIGAAVLIYLGIAVSTLHSGQNMTRVLTMFRSAAVSLIYDQSLLLEDDRARDGSTAMTLMSSDVDRISDALQGFNDSWSSITELIVGLVLLSLNIGWVSIVPLIVVILSTFAATIPARGLASTMKARSAASEKRVGVLSAFLKEIKSIKMTGLTERIGAEVQKARQDETEKMKHFSVVIVWKNLIANIPFVAAPAATFSVYAIQAYIRGTGGLDTTQAFTSLALISLVCDPAATLLQVFPTLASTFGCFDRIQDFLKSEKRVDQRSSSERPDEEVAIKVTGVTVRPTRTADIILEDVNMVIRQGSIAALSGPVGSGKSVLLRTILGEVPFEHGSIFVSTKRIAYCPQKTWLPNSTIRNAICGISEATTEIEIDEEWYSSVVEACALDYDLARLPNGHNTRVGNKGSAISGGQQQRISLARALYSRPSILIIDDTLSALDRKTERIVKERLLGSNGLVRRIKSTVIMATHATRHLALADDVFLLSSNSKSIQHGSYDELKKAGAIESLQLEDSKAIDADADDTADDDAPEEAAATEIADTLTADEKPPANVEKEASSRQSGDLTVYAYFFNHTGYWKLFWFTFFAAVSAFSGSFSLVILKWWSDAEGQHMVLYISLYILLSIGYSAGMGLYIYFIVVLIAPLSGQIFHNVLLKKVLKAPFSFFGKTDIGSLIARFSNDIRLVEFPLGTGILMVVSNILSAVMDAILVTLGSSYMTISVPFLVITVYFLQHIYLRTSRQLRLLDLESRSPLYAQFLESLEGLVSIRAFGWERRFIAENALQLDNSQRPAYLLASIQNWLALALDLISGSMAIVVIALALTLRHSTSPGLLGISLNSILGFNMSLSNFIHGWTSLETSIGAVARIREFEATVEEENQESEDFTPPSNWPADGAISLSDVSASYNPSAKALQNVTLSISAGTHVAICGRTGSGKSSLVSTILRMLDLSSGTITIDGIDITRIPRDVLRRCITTIPQDSFHIPGFNIRQTVDPFGITTSKDNADEIIISALTKVELWTPSTLAKYTLDEPINPETLSKGQQQLLALARAVIQRSKILILDEATSSVDEQTERTMRKLVKEEFAGCTTITVAHRRETILDAQQVVLMGAGKVIEVGAPDKLMESGKLKDLLEK